LPGVKANIVNTTQARAQPLPTAAQTPGAHVSSKGKNFCLVLDHEARLQVGVKSKEADSAIARTQQSESITRFSAESSGVRRRELTRAAQLYTETILFVMRQTLGHWKFSRLLPALCITCAAARCLPHASRRDGPRCSLQLP